MASVNESESTGSGAWTTARLAGRLVLYLFLADLLRLLFFFDFDEDFFLEKLFFFLLFFWDFFFFLEDVWDVRAFASATEKSPVAPNVIAAAANMYVNFLRNNFMVDNGIGVL